MKKSPCLMIGIFLFIDLDMCLRRNTYYLSIVSAMLRQSINDESRGSSNAKGAAQRTSGNPGHNRPREYRSQSV